MFQEFDDSIFNVSKQKRSHSFSKNSMIQWRYLWLFNTWCWDLQLDEPTRSGGRPCVGCLCQRHHVATSTNPKWFFPWVSLRWSFHYTISKDVFFIIFFPGVLSKSQFFSDRMRMNWRARPGWSCQEAFSHAVRGGKLCPLVLLWYQTVQWNKKPNLQNWCGVLDQLFI